MLERGASDGADWQVCYLRLTCQDKRVHAERTYVMKDAAASSLCPSLISWQLFVGSFWNAITGQSTLDAFAFTDERWMEADTEAAVAQHWRVNAVQTLPSLQLMLENVQMSDPA